LKLAYITYDKGSGSEESWALLYGEQAYVAKMMGDVWMSYEILIQEPITTANNKLVQRVLNSFYPGWDNESYVLPIVEKLRRLHYTFV